MPSDRDRDLPDEKKAGDKRSDETGRKQVIGRGMTSPDSTQVPLRAEDGEPDEDAIHGRISPDKDDENESRRR